MANKKTQNIVQEDNESKAGGAGNAMPDNFRVVFAWETVDFIKSPLADLYLTVAAIASMGMTAWGIYTKSFTVIVVFVMLAAVIILSLNEESKKLKVKVSESGVEINETHYDFSDFKSFNISYFHFHSAGSNGNPESSESEKKLPVLSLAPKKPYLPAMSIYIENEPEKDLEEFLEIYLPKEEKKV